MLSAWSLKKSGNYMINLVPGGYSKILGTDLRLKIFTTPNSKTTDKPNLQPILKPNFSVLPSDQ